MGWHVTFRLWSDRVIAAGEAELVAAVEVLTRVAAEDEVLDWHLADTHGHLLHLGDRRAAGRTASRLQVALHRRLRLAGGFQPARFTPVRDQRHLASAFWYILRQADHHGLVGDPWALGSCLPGLVGVRWGGAPLRERLARQLPRVREEELCAQLGWSGMVPLSLGEEAEELGLLGEAAALAVGRLSLEGRRREVVVARRAAVALGLQVARPVEVARVLGVDRATVCRRGRQEPDPGMLAVVRASWAWRCEVEAARREEAAAGAAGLGEWRRVRGRSGG